MLQTGKVNGVVIISIAYGVVSILLFLVYGVKIVNDSPRYLSYASDLQHGFYFDPHNFWYVGYVLFVYLVRLLTADPLAIILTQYLLGYLAVLALYRASILLFRQTGSALVTALAYIFFIEIATWHSYLLTESFYLSFTCFSLYILAALYRGGRGFFLYAAALLIIPLTILAKPTGIALLGAIVVAACYMLLRKVKSRPARWLMACTSLVLLLLLANKMLATYRVIENYRKGEIIYGIRTMPTYRHHDLMVVTPPADAYLPPPGDPPLARMAAFIFHHPLYWGRLFAAKLFYFIFHIRPYWSWGHNLFCLLFLVPVYLLGMRTLIKKRMPAAVSLFVTAYLLLHILSVSLTSVDWDGRFLMPLLPVLFMAGGYEVTHGVRLPRPARMPVKKEEETTT